MKKIGDNIILSAGDLAGHIACPHLTYLNMEVACGRMKPPEFYDPSLEIMEERGLEFEQAYLKLLKEKSCIISKPDPDVPAERRTIDAVEAGADIIYQASLNDGRWQGRADFLKKVGKPSKLGGWSYEVIDSKLARETSGGTILQLCLYSAMLENLQGILPEYMHVITPENEESYRVNEYMAYYRFAKRKLEVALDKGIRKDETYPDPVMHCDICRWWQHCLPPVINQ